MKRVVSMYKMVSVLFLCLSAQAKERSENFGSLDIPYALNTGSYTSDINVSKNEVTILAKKGTDLYTNADGSSSNDSAPRIFFEPKSDFTFSAKVTANFTTSYDGGALFIYADKDTWGKLLFERFNTGDNGIASTVNRSTGDDAYHHLIEKNETNFKIERKNDQFTFYYSEDGKQWSYLRSFSMKSPKVVKVGFLAQSPISQSHNVVFSNIMFTE